MKSPPVPTKSAPDYSTVALVFGLLIILVGSVSAEADFSSGVMRYAHLKISGCWLSATIDKFIQTLPQILPKNL